MELDCIPRNFSGAVIVKDYAGLNLLILDRGVVDSCLEMQNERFGFKARREAKNMLKEEGYNMHLYEDTERIITPYLEAVCDEGDLSPLFDESDEDEDWDSTIESYFLDPSHGE